MDNEISVGDYVRILPGAIISGPQEVGGVYRVQGVKRHAGRVLGVFLSSAMVAYYGMREVEKVPAPVAVIEPDPAAVKVGDYVRILPGADLAWVGHRVGGIYTVQGIRRNGTGSVNVYVEGPTRGCYFPHEYEVVRSYRDAGDIPQVGDTVQVLPSASCYEGGPQRGDGAIVRDIEGSCLLYLTLPWEDRQVLFTTREVTLVSRAVAAPAALTPDDEDLLAEPCEDPHCPLCHPLADAAEPGETAETAEDVREKVRAFIRNSLSTLDIRTVGRFAVTRTLQALADEVLGEAVSVHRDPVVTFTAVPA